ncbi:hypothetical protein IS396_001670 [Salmonella enterica]|nr:hypothetical protein [Salmonella enterica]EGO0094620.1 hypothetical protein [Salmonella enterica]
MCERVALERQLDEDDRLSLLARSQDVIQRGREILYGWDSAETPVPRLSEALDKYATALASGSVALPVLSDDISPALSEQAQCVVQQIVHLPHWTHPAMAAKEQA